MGAKGRIPRLSNGIAAMLSTSMGRSCSAMHNGQQQALDQPFLLDP